MQKGSEKASRLAMLPNTIFEHILALAFPLEKEVQPEESLVCWHRISCLFFERSIYTGYDGEMLLI